MPLHTSIYWLDHNTYPPEVEMDRYLVLIEQFSTTQFEILTWVPYIDSVQWSTGSKSRGYSPYIVPEGGRILGYVPLYSDMDNLNAFSQTTKQP